MLYLYICAIGIILICIVYFVTLFDIPEDGHDHGEDDHSSGDEEAKTLGSSGAVAFSAGGVIFFGVVGLIMMA